MLRRLLLATLAVPASLSAQMPARDLTPLVNRVFARWDSTTGPGCAVGIDRTGAPRFSRAFGEADLEYDIPNRPETIFEAGSISKQFTAAATVLLALDGKLNLADDVRKYVPELPSYERPITIRHLLNHTSGLRDWGEIAALAGWPRETRVHTHDDVLDILSRQRALNYPPGDKYSYTNSGYNLLAIIVSRVSGQPFATFSRERLFKPLGLTSTQWRDDFRRIVKGRAQAYSRSNGGQWQLQMPFENVHGNGGLLTTVSDLLTWTAMLEHPTPAWKPMVDSMHVRGRLTSGDTIDYALGLFVSDYRGLHRVEHSGATAGYRADVLRFPGRGLAIAVLCNAANAVPTQYANQLVDSLLAPSLGPLAARPPRPRPDSSTWKPNASDLAVYAGTYYSPDVETALEVSVTNGALTLFRRPAMRTTLRPVSPDTFTGFDDRVWFTRDAAGRVTALHVAGGRAYDVVFERRQGQPPQTLFTQTLFNGRDLSGWHVDVPAADSNARVRSPFVVRNGMLVSLGEPGGHLITDSSYRDYRLEVEYRFPGTPGNAGVLVHASTPRALYGMFPRSIEVQMESGNAGDFWCIVEDIRVPDMERRRGPRAQWGTTEGKARRILNLTDNSEKPVGEWNTMVIEAVGRSIKVWVNGDLVNEGSDATADHGQIALQSEGSEVEFRKLSLTRK